MDDVPSFHCLGRGICIAAVFAAFVAVAFIGITSDQDADAAALIDSGSCGDALDWKYYDDYSLMISGAGEMYDYDDVDPPWKPYWSDILTIEVIGASNVGDYAFDHCEKLKKVTLADSVKAVGDFSFSDCMGLETCIMKKVETLGGGSFNMCYSLKSIELPDTLTSLGTNAFSPSGLESITIPDSITVIPYFTFDSCGSLKTVVMSDSVTTIQSGAFRECRSLTTITIPGGVTKIGSDAFPWDKITSVTFDGCELADTDTNKVASSVKTVNIGSGTTGLENILGDLKFFTKSGTALDIKDLAGYSYENDGNGKMIRNNPIHGPVDTNGMNDGVFIGIAVGAALLVGGLYTLLVFRKS